MTKTIYLVSFEAHEMIQMTPDKVPTEKEALLQLNLAQRAYAQNGISPDWKMTQVIEMDEDGDIEYLVYDGSRWVNKEELECDG